MGSVDAAAAPGRVLSKGLYTTAATASGGRAGHATSEDRLLDVELAVPRELGGSGGATNPEQLFAAGYAACFQSALGVVAKRGSVEITDSQVTATVTLGTAEDAGYGLAVRLQVEIPELDDDQVRDLALKAHAVCPYSRAVQGNVPVEIAVGPSEPASTAPVQVDERKVQMADSTPAQATTKPFKSDRSDNARATISGGRLTDVEMVFHADGDQTGGALCVFEVKMSPGDRARPHVHHWEDEGFYVLDGRLELTVEGNDLVLERGEFGWAPRDIPHKYVAGPEGAHVFVIGSPGKTLSGFFRAVGAGRGENANTPEGAAEFAAWALREHGVEYLGGEDA